jgi:hypothetical protein
MQVFLSYHSSDKAFAKRLAAHLEKQGLSVWTDDEVLPGDNVWLRTGEALKKSRAMVVVVSPNAMRSENVRHEIEYALGERRYEGRLFAVQARPTKEVPWILARLKALVPGPGPEQASRQIATALMRVA